MAAKFRSGYATMVDYTPSGAAVSAGQFVALGSGKTYGIAHVDIADGQAGAISIPNGSVIYEIDKAPATDVYAVGDLVEVDLSAHAAVPASDAAGDLTLGRCVKASANGATTVMVQLIPIAGADPTV